VDPIATRIVGASAINVEAVKTYTASQIDNALIGTIRSETDAFMANADAIESSLGAAADPRIKMVPGVQIQSAGDLDLNTGWDLLDWRYGGQAGVLTLHAAGNLNLNQSLSDAVKPESALDGFTPRDVVQTGPSWTYRIVAGAVSAAADPLAVTSEIGAPGDVVLKSGTIVRTGTGDIGIAAAHDLRFEDSSAVIYTAGENRGPGALPANSAGGPEVTQELLYAADFLKDGGDIRIAAGNDVIGKNSGQLVNEWLARVGNENNVLPTGDSFSIGSSWAVSVGNFRQTIGALGGGDVSVTAGGSLRDLSVVVPTTGLPTGEVGALPDIAGGGDIHVEAGGDLRGGMIYLGKGKARVNVGGSVLGSDTMPALPVLALGDGQYTVQARKDLGVDAVVNPTVLSMNPAQGTPDIGKVAADNVFFTYGPESAVRLGSIAGSLSLRGDVNAMKGTFTALNSTSDSEPLRYFPGDLRLRSLQGDVRIEPSITLLPSPEGNLEILAQRDIRPGSSNTTVRMSDADPALLPGVANPRTGLAASGGEDVANQLLEHSPTLLHTGDSVVARVTAQTGTIGSPDDNPLAFQLRLEIPKPARVFAGSDINNLALSVQHANATDISVVQAGGEIVFPTLRDGDGSVSTRTDREFEFAGPGEVYILAGRDVDLGAAKGIVSIGNQDNPALPDGGANITVMTGQKTPAAYDSFIDKYLVQSDAYSEALTAYMQSLGLTDTSVGAFQSLPRDKQRKLIHEILFAELREAGKRAAETGQTEDYERGYDAIRTLFPADSYPGDLKSFLSRIYTRDGGDINLIVPGGLVNAGVASATAIAKQPDELGVVAESTGNINAMVHGDFLVNQSRVFALDGGDLLLWSSAGDIDAGKGAKTALAVPPPVAVTDVHGNTIVEFPPAISGSGIKSSVRTIGREPGDVFLVAPVGIVDAGDAGIEAAGNITIAATAVLGASNIKVGGVSVGVPAGGSGAGAVSASVSAAAASAAKSGEEGATQKTAVMDKDGNISIIEVEVVGFGNENDGEKEDKKDCKPNDKDCQKG
jgi:hypothetical protein